MADPELDGVHTVLLDECHERHLDADLLLTLLLDARAGLRPDLRILATSATVATDRLTEMPRVGPVGASIFLREVQLVWPEFRPHLDGKAIEGARAVGLPTDTDELAALVDPDDLARFSAALVRADLDDDVAEEVDGR